MPARFIDSQAPRSGLALPLAFTITLFASAFLLFAVQPIVSRMVLPRLGGSPAVWNMCVCFFQAMLLLGYAYADWSAMRLRLGRQLALHAAVLLAGITLMPLSIGAATPPPQAIPALWLLGRLAITIGPPFFAISATAPLLQHWFSRTRQTRAADPYFLYAASNAGSLLALLTYPLVVEPLLGIHAQTLFWSTAFVAVAGLVLACGALAFFQPHEQEALSAREEQTARPSARTQLRWATLAFVPSGLMLAVTTYITTDIAAAPLFWVIPLAIYILTFMLAFGRQRRAMPRFLLPLQVLSLVGAAIAALMSAPNLLALSLALLVFALTAAACHFELANRRPPAAQLTRYFLLISIGGALGGVFNALIAPVLFRGPWEYPLLLILACAIRPAAAKPENSTPSPSVPQGSTFKPLRVAALLIAGAGLVYGASPAAPAFIRPFAIAAGVLLPAGALLFLSRRGAYLGVGLAGLLIVPLCVRAVSAERSVRSFFGTYRIVRFPAQGVTVLQHGTTFHGFQSERPEEATLPLGYYARSGPFGRFFTAFRKSHPAPIAVNVIGLGAGGLGCYALPGDRWSFREIDPVVERLARDDRYFHFMKRCGNDPAVTIGDARVTLAHDTDARYDVLIIDAFSSDSVPVHLLTQEALALYFSRLRPGGVVLFHISNRYLTLVPVVARLAKAAGAPARHLIAPATGDGYRTAAAEVIAVASPGGSLDGIAADGWDVPAAGPVLWTDDESDIARVISW